MMMMMTTVSNWDCSSVAVNVSHLFSHGPAIVFRASLQFSVQNVHAKDTEGLREGATQRPTCATIDVLLKYSNTASSAVGSTYVLMLPYITQMRFSTPLSAYADTWNCLSPSTNGHDRYARFRHTPDEKYELSFR